MSDELLLDPAIRDWVLLPIMAVMILVGVLRHYATLLMSAPPKNSAKACRETNGLTRAAMLRTNGNVLPHYSFETRRKCLIGQFQRGHFLKSPLPDSTSSKPEQNADESLPQMPMQDPAQMDAMMDGMKKNMMMMLPQMLIMGWVSTFFSGFVLIRLPVPLTLRFKAMLQRGIETSEMNVSWVSSLSWYFINLFGLRGIFSLLLGDENGADGVKDMQAMTMPQQQMMMAQPQDVHKQFLSEKESLELSVHEWDLANIEERVVKLLIASLEESTPAHKKSK